MKNTYEKASENNARFLESRASANGKAVRVLPRAVVPGQNWVQKVNKIFSRVCLLFPVFTKICVVQVQLESESVKIQNLSSEKNPSKKAGKSRIFLEDYGT